MIVTVEALREINEVLRMADYVENPEHPNHVDLASMG